MAEETIAAIDNFPTLLQEEINNTTLLPETRKQTIVDSPAASKQTSRTSGFDHPSNGGSSTRDTSNEDVEQVAPNGITSVDRYLLPEGHQALGSTWRWTCLVHRQ